MPEADPPNLQPVDVKTGNGIDRQPNTFEQAPPSGFEEDDALRSAFLRRLMLCQSGEADAVIPAFSSQTPRILVRYWHDPNDVPGDVRVCLASWDRLQSHGFEMRTFDEPTPAAALPRWMLCSLIFFSSYSAASNGHPQKCG